MAVQHRDKTLHRLQRDAARGERPQRHVGGHLLHHRLLIAVHLARRLGHDPIDDAIQTAPQPTGTHVAHSRIDAGRVTGGRAGERAGIQIRERPSGIPAARSTRELDGDISREPAKVVIGARSDMGCPSAILRRRNPRLRIGCGPPLANFDKSRPGGEYRGSTRATRNPHTHRDICANNEGSHPISGKCGLVQTQRHLALFTGAPAQSWRTRRAIALGTAAGTTPDVGAMYTWATSAPVR